MIEALLELLPRLINSAFFGLFVTMIAVVAGVLAFFLREWFAQTYENPAQWWHSPGRQSSLYGSGMLSACGLLLADIEAYDLANPARFLFFAGIIMAFITVVFPNRRLEE